MPNRYSRSPKLLRCALVKLPEPFLGPVPNIIVFQYNPETMTRRLEAPAMGSEGGDTPEVYRLAGPPHETITLSVEVGAAGQLERKKNFVKGLER